MAQVRVIIIEVKDNDSSVGQSRPPVLVSENQTLAQVFKEQGISVDGKQVKFQQQTINNINLTIKEIKNQQNIKQNVLPIRIFQKAIGGQN